jgi:spore germination protein KC
MALAQVQKEMKADILGLAQDFHRFYPKQWNKVKDRWDEVFPSIQILTEVDVNINRPGLGTVPAAIPRDEVRKK